MDSLNPNLADGKIPPDTKTVIDRQHKRLPISLWITVSVFALVPVARWLLFETDHQLANIAGIGIYPWLHHRLRERLDSLCKDGEEKAFFTGHADGNRSNWIIAL